MERAANMHVAVVFDTPYPKYTVEDHLARMEEELNPEREEEAETEYQVAGALRDKGHEISLVGVHDDPAYALEALREKKVDMVFNASEGFRQRDGLDYLIPALLEAEGHPYTGSSPVGLMLTRNKGMSKKILAHHGVRVPEFRTYRIGEKVKRDAELPFPMIVKPLSSDASVGISKSSIVRDMDALTERVEYIHERFRDAAIAEQFIDGRELYVSVLGNGKRVELLPTVELVFDKEKTKPEERIATQAAKWDDPYRERNGIRSVFARPLSKLAVERLEEACRTAYHALWLRDYARLDVRLDDNDEVWVLEANANPFLAVGHEVANAAEKHGLAYADFIDKIVRAASARYRNGKNGEG